jgi:hypothetical protein
MPRNNFGNLSRQLFKNFIDKCLPEYGNVISNTEFNETYKGVVNMKSNDSIIKGDTK